MNRLLRPLTPIVGKPFILLILGLFLLAPDARAQQFLELLTADSPLNLLSNGGFEVTKPAYWEPSGEGAMWSREHART
ncbi:MAG: hypothetical protein D6746_15720, partial [Bacteroidetes bacterium]